MAISSQAPQECGEGSTTRAWSPDRTVKPHECTETKACAKCGTEKPLDSFDEKRNVCKRCRLDARKFKYATDEAARGARLATNDRWRVNNPQAKIAADAKSYDRRKADILKQKRAYHSERYRTHIRPYKEKYLARPDVIEGRREYSKQYHIGYYANNKARYLAKFIARRIAKEAAIPKWASRPAIDAIYEQARRMTAETNIRHEVDHIIPLISEVVCGLHVEANLRVITRAENRKKSNKLV